MSHRYTGAGVAYMSYDTSFLEAYMDEDIEWEDEAEPDFDSTEDWEDDEDWVHPDEVEFEEFYD